MTHPLAALLFDAWDDLDRATDGLSAAEATAVDNGSSFAWTVGHLANQLDAWTNVRFAGHEPHPVISDARFRVGGSGAADDWDGVRNAALEVRDHARKYLQGVTAADLDRRIPYNGSFTQFHETGITLRYALHRTIAHHYFHIGEIASKRDRLGHSAGDYPGRLDHSAAEA
jgi:hypothetical protein